LAPRSHASVALLQKAPEIAKDETNRTDYNESVLFVFSHLRPFLIGRLYRLEFCSTPVAKKVGQILAIRDASGVGIEGVSAVSNKLSLAIRILHRARRNPGRWPLPPQSLLDRVYVFIFCFPFHSSATAGRKQLYPSTELVQSNSRQRKRTKPAPVAAIRRGTGFLARANEFASIRELK
jgi:hypothetical protein